MPEHLSILNQFTHGKLGKATGMTAGMELISVEVRLNAIFEILYSSLRKVYPVCDKRGAC